MFILGAEKIAQEISSLLCEDQHSDVQNRHRSQAGMLPACKLSTEEGETWDPRDKQSGYSSIFSSRLFPLSLMARVTYTG